jgi:SNF2 family DNA or RNA helicase
VRYEPEPHQITGRDFLASRYHAACGDEPGLMKTYTALLAAEKLGARSGLVVCPASVRTHWREHIVDVFAHVGTRDWDVISYNGASDLAVRAKLRKRYDVFIPDEVHFCKNTDSLRTRAVFAKPGYGPGNEPGLAYRAERKFPLSGTITPNYRPVELWPMLKSLCPAFRDMTFAGYAQKYCGAFWDGRQLNVKGASRIEELSRLLSDFMIRRTEAEVYPDRVKPIVERIPVDLTVEDMAEILKAEAEIGAREALLSQSAEKWSQMGDFSRLRRLLGAAKARHVAAFVEDLLGTVEKVVVFAHHKDVIRLLAAHFQQAGLYPAVYEGGMTDAQKDSAKTCFTKLEESRVFVGQDDTAGTGVDGLQHASATMVFAEPSWVPGDTDQRLRRLARKGQKEPLVKAYLMYAAGTVDSVMTQVHDRKERTGERLMAPASSPFDVVEPWELL